MSVNKHKPHVLVLPEDDANRQIANGFLLEVDGIRQIQILPEAGGWSNVCKVFAAEHATAMHSFPKRHIVLLVDFDNQEARLEQVKKSIPVNLDDRVFVLGVQSHPEHLKQRISVSSYERIGRTLGQECRDGTRDLWAHQLLQHNNNELARLALAVRPILFGIGGA